MNVTPRSAATSRIRSEVASSLCPANVIVPRQISDTFRPVRPIRRCFMANSTRVKGARLPELSLTRGVVDFTAVATGRLANLAFPGELSNDGFERGSP